MTEEDDSLFIQKIYLLVLEIFCFVAMALNLVVLVSVFWIRTPMTPILKMSLSLAAADACASMLYGSVLFINYNMYLEIIKLMGIVITVAHLLALSLNHYLGILKPLHYNSIVTKRKLAIVIILLWICPVLLVGFICVVESINYEFDSIDNVHINDTNETFIIKMNDNETIASNLTPLNFMDTFSFRISYSSLFFIPMFLMAFCYTHILFIVRRQQKTWKNLSRIGSTKWRGRTVNNCSTSKVLREQRQLEGNLRAIFTTLLIMGSCFVGWMPALFLYSLMCRKGCYWSGDQLDNLNENYANVVMTFRLLDNLLVILKMMVNVIIYSIRMKEIKVSHMRVENYVTFLSFYF